MYLKWRFYFILFYIFHIISKWYYYIEKIGFALVIQKSMHSIGMAKQIREALPAVFFCMFIFLNIK